MSEIVIAGGGAAGMFCAAYASELGHRVTIAEHNEKLGKKLFITGKGRCNFTNHCPPEEFLAHVLTNSRFLYSAAYGLTPDDVIACFERWGLPSKTERGRRVFPVSDHSSDVIAAMERVLRKNRVKVLLHTEAVRIVTADGAVTGLAVKRGDAESILPADYVVIACGGLSYPSTGSTGDGYLLAKAAGHTVTATSPSLVPIVCEGEYIRQMQGLSLKNVSLTISDGRRVLFSEQGEMMFTHFGITGPLVLSASAVMGDRIGRGALVSVIDLKPALTEEQLDGRIIRIVNENPNKALKNILHELYPQKMHAVILSLAGIAPDTKLHDLTKPMRAELVRVTKHFPLTLAALRGYNEAVVTKGGVSVKEIDPRSMQSRKVKGLCFIGEVLDLDAFTGGYNLQIAWCTAAACAEHFS